MNIGKLGICAIASSIAIALAACGATSAGSATSTGSAASASSTAASEHVYDFEAHRGGRDARPENTLYSYQYALEQGATTIECDMQMTKDGVIVLSHNPSLNPDITLDKNGERVEKGKYYINELTLDELRQFDVGHMDESSEYYNLHGKTQVATTAQIPTLRELFELVKASGNDKVRMNIETKNYPDPACGEEYEHNNNMTAEVEQFYALVKEFGFEGRVTLQSFDWSTLVMMKKIDPSIKTVALYNEQPSWGEAAGTTLWLDREEASPWLGGVNIHDFNNNPAQAAHSLGIDYISPYYEEVTADLVTDAHNLGMKVIPWSVNHAEDMEKLYTMGVDGIITDRPWTLREFLESKGESLLPKASVDLPYHLDPDHYDVQTDKVAGGGDASH